MSLDSTGDPLSPPFEPEAQPPGWEGALWIGVLDLEDARLVSQSDIALSDAAGFNNARLLIRESLYPRGFVTVRIKDGMVNCAAILKAANDLPIAALVGDQEDSLPGISVAISTRNRPELVRHVVPSLLTLDYPNYEVLIVDNASDDDSTFDYVSSIIDPRIRYIREDRPGLSRGRNRALLEARYVYVAFTDDDAYVDPGWLRGIARGFRRGSPGIVCGMVASGELVSEAQDFFERRIRWVGAIESRVFSLNDPPKEEDLFPFEIGVYGTGANFAIRRDIAISLGGFNEALGAGTATGGGEDIDMFVRMLFAGELLACEPSALIWHKHRRENDALSEQMVGYGRGLGAWLTTVLCTPDMLRVVLRLGPAFARRLKTLGIADESRTPDGPQFPAPRRGQIIAEIIEGSFYYVRGRASGRWSRPLAPRSRRISSYRPAN